MDKIIALETGSGSATKFYNTCFVFYKKIMNIDCSGGINILEQFDKANISI